MRENEREKSVRNGGQEEKSMKAEIEEEMRIT